MYGKEVRWFYPKRTDDLNPKCFPYIGKEVEVLSRHDTSKGTVGFIKEFMLDIPEYELELWERESVE